jgi:hypothetical protein
MNDRRSAESVRYIRFANDEARGHSPLYESFARGVADDPEIIDFLLTLPTEKRQPNLLFAAVRHLFGVPMDWPAFRKTLLANPDAVRPVLLQHATQTNEPARCATLLPVLAQLPQPLALIEVGASAGLCLLPDYYAYDYGNGIVRAVGTDSEPPVFACSVSLGTPLPAAIPRIVWRAGLDLNPLDASDRSKAAWLETLVWPEQTERLVNLRAAIKIAAVLKPRVMKGDLLGDALPRLCREAPKGITLVIFHTAVLAYIADPAARQSFATVVRSLCQYWISNESPRVFADQAALTGKRGVEGRFLMSVNGNPVAWTDPHGAALEWIHTATGPWRGAG